MARESRISGLVPNYTLEDVPNRLFALYPYFEMFYNAKVDPKTGLAKIERMRKIEHRYMEGDTGRVIFKDPRWALRLKWLQETFPSCYVVAIVRNPYATIAGIRKRTRQLADIVSSAAQWLACNTVMELDSVDVDRFRWVKYEDMICSPDYPHESDKFWGELLEWLDLDTSKFVIPNDYTKRSQLKTGKNAANIALLSRWDTRLITQMAGHFMQRFGYDMLTV